MSFPRRSGPIRYSPTSAAPGRVRNGGEPGCRPDSPGATRAARRAGVARWAVPLVLGPVAATGLGGVACGAAFALGGGAAFGAGTVLLAGLLGLELAALAGIGAALVPAPRRGRVAARTSPRRRPPQLRRSLRLVHGGVH